MAEERVDYTNFRKALRNLEERYGELQSLPDDTPLYLRESVKESVIQRFEVCYDTLWKALHLYLGEVVKIVLPPLVPIRILRAAGEAGVMPLGAAQRWRNYITIRVGTTHAYGAEKADAALAIVPDFISDARALQESMDTRVWE